MPTFWQPAPDHLRLEPGWVHLIRFSLQLDEPALARMRGLLSPEEAARADRYRPPAARRAFTAARGQMRILLAAYLGAEPAALRFDEGAQGKPFLPGSPLRFNLSHSAGLGLLAVTTDYEVGVDVESSTREVEFGNLARRFFAPAETQALLALPADLQPPAFFRIWTRKEAVIKARGQGLSIPLDSFSVSLEDDEARFTGPQDFGLSLYALDPGPGYAAALAVEGSPRGLRCWAWEG